MIDFWLRNPLMEMAGRAFSVVVCHENGPTAALNTDYGLFLLA